MYEYNATVLKVIDADTLALKVDLGMSVFVKQHIRLSGVNTPEVYGVKKESVEYKLGQEASGFVSGWLDSTERKVVIKTVRDKREKFGRYLATVTAVSGPHVGRTLQEAIIEAGYNKLTQTQKAETD
jgi:micrococcal nuclease